MFDGDEPTEGQLRAALKADRKRVLDYLAERIVTAEETPEEGARDLLAYTRDYDWSDDEDVVALWDMRFGLAESTERERPLDQRKVEEYAEMIPDGEFRPVVRHEPEEHREAVREEVGRVLEVIARVTGNPGVLRAYVSTRSTVGHFPLIRHVGRDLPEMDIGPVCAALTAEFGFPVTPTDTLIAVARRIANG